VWLAALLLASRAWATYPNNIKDSDDEAFAGGASMDLISWHVSEPYINLWLGGTPLSYQTSEGQTVPFSVAYKQRNSRPQSANIYGLGPLWECSWLSYVKYSINTNVSPAVVTVLNTYMPLGGERSYTPDGVTKEFKSSTTMTTLTNGNGTLNGFRINLPTGGSVVYNYLLNLSTNENYAFMTQQIDPAARTNVFSYDTISSVVRLRRMVDFDNRTNIVGYNATFTAQVGAVTNHYGAVATFGYDGNGWLTNAVNAGSLASGITYDTNGLVSYLTNDYGNTSFSATTNSFGGYMLGGTNQVNRSLLVTEPDSGRQMWLYRDQSTKLNPYSSTDLIPYAYTNEAPSTSPYTNTLDNTWMDARNSYHWGRAQFDALSTNFLGTLQFTNLTLGDYTLARLRHWLRGYTNETVVTETLSLERAPSPDGSTYGQKSWFDYTGKVSNWYTRGTNASPLFAALVLPDGTSRYSYTERNFPWEKVTKQVGTYSGSGGVAQRTTTFTFAANGIDLLITTNAAGVQSVSNAFNSYHQVTTSFNALSEATTFTYDGTTHKLLSTKTPSGLTATNLYYTSGSHIGWLQQSIDLEISRTNSFTYLNGLVQTHTDPRGLIITNTYDGLERPIIVASPAWSVVSTYSKMDLTQLVDTLNHTNQWTHDALQRKTQQLDAKTNLTRIAYCGCGSPGLVTNAVGTAVERLTTYSYDLAGRKTNYIVQGSNLWVYAYDSLGNLTNTHGWYGGMAVNQWYNNQGLLSVSSNDYGQIILKQYDILDRVVSTVDANGIATTNTYDSLGRLIKKTYPDGNTETYTYSALGLMAYTNQLGNFVHYGYDVAGRKLAETNANSEVIRYSYNPAGDLLMLVDAKSQTNLWGYDLFGQVTNQVDAASNTIFIYKYDAGGRLTNRWSAAKGNTYYAYDAVGNLTGVTYPTSPSISFSYDALNRITTMSDAVGTSSYTYTPWDAVLTDDGPWDNDTITHTFSDKLFPTGWSLAQPNAPALNLGYSWDNARRLTAVVGSMGTFTYSYYSGVGSITTPSTLVKKLSLPNSAYITNTFDTLARLTGTYLKHSSHTNLNYHTYEYNVGSQRTKQTRADASFVEYTYDPIGQLKTATGKESGGSPTRLQEKLAYVYDAAGNLQYRTNNAMVQTFNVNNLNELTTVTRSGTLTVAGTTTSAATNVTVAANGGAAQTATRYGDKTFAMDGFSLSDGTNTFTAVAQDSAGRGDTNISSVYLPATATFTYDLNGNLTSDGRRGFDYDDENQLIRITVTNAWKSEFSYDGRHRRRVRREWSWQNSAWVKTEEVRYVYDANLVIQERDVNNFPTVSYTRGRDLSGSIQGAGGIGGLLASSRPSALSVQHSYFHSDGNGNVTALVDGSQAVVAKYLYDPYGNLLSKTGPQSDANLYRFSSKEAHAPSGLVYYLYRYYEPGLQRWVNRDPIGVKGGLNVFSYAHNRSPNYQDAFGHFVCLYAQGQVSKRTLSVQVDAYLPITYVGLQRSEWSALDQYISYAQSVWSGTGKFSAHGRKVQLTFKLHIVRDDTMLNPVNMVLRSPTNPDGNQALTKMNAWAYINGVDDATVLGDTSGTWPIINDLMVLGPRAGRKTFAHEIGHIMYGGEAYDSNSKALSELWRQNVMAAPVDKPGPEYAQFAHFWNWMNILYDNDQKHNVTCGDIGGRTVFDAIRNFLELDPADLQEKNRMLESARGIVIDPLTPQTP